jgi:hypothetical protein
MMVVEKNRRIFVQTGFVDTPPPQPPPPQA